MELVNQTFERNDLQMKNTLDHFNYFSKLYSKEKFSVE